MATLDTLEVSYDRKIQLEQFEPVSAGAVATFSLAADDDPYEVYQAGQATVQTMVERDLATRIARNKLIELGPSAPKIRAVIQDHTTVLDDDTIDAIVADLLAE